MDLSRDQAEVLLASFRPMLDFCNRALERMDDIDVPSSDDFYQQVAGLRTSLQDLTMHLHYKTCPDKVRLERTERA
jgi:hypothetical protein